MAFSMAVKMPTATDASTPRRAWRRCGRICNLGLSLTELIVAMLIMMIILAGVFVVTMAGQRSYYIGDARIQVEQEARRALDTVAKELRSAAKSTVVLADGNA